MKRRHQRRVAIRLPVAAQFRDADGLAKQSFHPRRAKGDQHLRTNQINLFVEIRDARRHFFWRRLAIASGLSGGVRPAFQDVRNVNIRARKPGGLDDLCEQLSRGTDERFALRVLGCAGQLLCQLLSQVIVIDARFGLPENEAGHKHQPGTEK